MLKLGGGEGVVGHFQTLKSTFTWLGALSLFEMKDISGNYSSVLIQFPFKSLCGVYILEREEQTLAHDQVSG